MWKAGVGRDVSVKVEAQGDDWDTDPDFVNDLSEKEQRWGAKTVEGSGRAEHFDIHQLRSKVSVEHEVIKKKELESGPKASYGYGGKFGTERDRMDKCAVGHEYVAEVGKHCSQTDVACGFGGKYGVQRDRVDKSAVGFEYKGEVEKHSSQKDYSRGFGGRYGVERDKVDRAAVGFDYRSQAGKHGSQTDYSVGFGGKFGVQRDHQDKSALGWDHREDLQPHASQTDHAKGFGGRHGLQKDREDKSAAGFDEMASPSSSYKRTRPLEAGAASGTSSLRSRFEDMARPAAQEERARRQAGHKETRREDEETAPTLPPRPPDLGRIPSRDQPAYSDTAGVGGDYEELPESAECCGGAGGDADYEEVPAPCAKWGGDDGADGGEDYAEILPEEPGRGQPRAGQSDSIYELDSLGTCAVALYDYQGEGEDELSFDPNDMITHIEMVTEDWWRGLCWGKIGLFPANYVKLLQ